MNTKHELLNISKGFILGITVILGMSAIAWNGPVSAPPNYNAYAPINISAASQTKDGALWAGSFLTTGGGYFGGDVGIGTSNPGAKLSIVDSASCGSGVTAFGAGDVFEIHNEGANDSFRVDDSTSDATPFVINNDGRVGIGTTNPNQKLSVVGVVESTSGGFKFPDGTTQTTASSQSCSWVSGSNTTSVSCPSNQYVVAGGCYAGTYNDRGLVESTPTPIGCTGNSCTGWYCLYSNSNATVSVRCCSN